MSSDSAPSPPPSSSLILGQHVISDYYGCDARILDDLAGLEAMLLAAARHAGATPIKQEFHRFLPQGVSGVVIIAESHLTIHTWPEHGYAAVDFFTCGAHTHPLRAHELLTTSLGATDSRYQILQRGLQSAAATQPVQKI